MNRPTSLLPPLLVGVMLVAWLPPQAEAKSYSSGGGRSYSSSSRSSGSGSRSSSAGRRSFSPTTSSASRGASSSGNGKSFRSSSGRGYSSGSSREDSTRSYSSGKSYASGLDRGFSPGAGRGNTGASWSGKPGSAPNALTFDTEAARARKEETSRQAFSRFNEAQARAPDAPRQELTAPPAATSRSTSYGASSSRRTLYVPEAQTLSTRPIRIDRVFRPYYTRPVVIYQDPYGSFFWWWLLDRSLEDRALWAYHHRSTMDAARYQALLAQDAQLETRVRQLEAQQVAVDPKYVPPGLDPDLMYSDRYVQRAYHNRPTTLGRVSFWILAVPMALGLGGLLIWLVFLKRWSV